VERGGGPLCALAAKRSSPSRCGGDLGEECNIPPLEIAGKKQAKKKGKKEALGKRKEPRKNKATAYAYDQGEPRETLSYSDLEKTMWPFIQRGEN